MSKRDPNKLHLEVELDRVESAEHTVKLRVANEVNTQDKK